MKRENETIMLGELNPEERLKIARGEAIAVDVTVQNMEILRGRLEQAELALQAIAYLPIAEQDDMPAENMRAIAKQFLVSQQGEQHSCKNFLGVDPESCMFKHPEQAEGAQGERERFEVEMLELCLPIERDSHGAYVSDHVRHLWSGWELRAALAQPSPVFAKPSLLKDCDVRYAANAQPSPELEQYKAILRTLVEEATCADWSGENDESVFHAAQQWCGKYHEAKRQLEAAQARVAELERVALSLIPWMERANEKSHDDIPELMQLRAVLSGIPAPVAQDGQVPSVCDGKEQDAFESWASGQKMDMSCHPLHWLFLNDKTYSARQGWKAALEYVSAQIAAAPAQGE